VLRRRALGIDERAVGHIRFEHKAHHIGCWLTGSNGIYCRSACHQTGSLSSWDLGLSINSCTSEPNSSVRYCPRYFPRASPYPGPPRQRSSVRGSSPIMTPAFTRLQKHDPQRNQHRYYLLSIRPNLFGTWSLIREWGRIGRPGQVKIDLCDSLEEATNAFRGKLHQKQRRGYAYPSR
jgi:predicted DNA-binding WGR domain protein